MGHLRCDKQDEDCRRPSAVVNINCFTTRRYRCASATWASLDPCLKMFVKSTGSFCHVCPARGALSGGLPPREKDQTQYQPWQPYVDEKVTVKHLQPWQQRGRSRSMAAQQSGLAAEAIALAAWRLMLSGLRQQTEEIAVGKRLGGKRCRSQCRRARQHRSLQE